MGTAASPSRRRAPLQHAALPVLRSHRLAFLQRGVPARRPAMPRAVPSTCQRHHRRRRGLRTGRTRCGRRAALRTLRGTRSSRSAAARPARGTSPLPRAAAVALTTPTLCLHGTSGRWRRHHRRLLLRIV